MIGEGCLSSIRQSHHLLKCLTDVAYLQTSVTSHGWMYLQSSENCNPKKSTASQLSSQCSIVEENRKTLLAESHI